MKIVGKCFSEITMTCRYVTRKQKHERWVENNIKSANPTHKHCYFYTVGIVNINLICKIFAVNLGENKCPVYTKYEHRGEGKKSREKKKKE